MSHRLCLRHAGAEVGDFLRCNLQEKIQAHFLDAANTVKSIREKFLIVKKPKRDWHIKKDIHK